MAGGSIPAIAYYRMSTHRQDAGVPDQRAAVEKLARDRGYEIVGADKDERSSGDDAKRRAGGRKVLTDVGRPGDVRAVLFGSQDCFGRSDRPKAGYVVRPVRDARVRPEN